MLFYIILLPVFGCFILFFIPNSNKNLIKNFSLLWSLLILNITFFLLLYFDPTNIQFQMVDSLNWFSILNISFIVGIDGLAFYMILLTAFLIPICILLAWGKSVGDSVKNYCIAFLLLESILFTVFTSLDLVVFYLSFEAVLIPMFLIIGFYGSRERKIRSAYLLFLYTLISSIIMFLAILYIYFKFGTTDYITLKTIKFDLLSEKICWFSFFLSFAVKMPLVPFHIWLPEAHCEAPTAGSVILAGILLKLGGYGFIRFSIGLFPDASAYFSPLIFMVSILGIVYASITTMQQIDLKKIIAYSSVGHMGVVTIGIFSYTAQGILGSVFLMISHGIVSGALFLCIGFLYERHHTRIVKYFSGLHTTMPLFSVFFTVFTLANIGLPGTSSFIGEFLIIAGSLLINTLGGLFCATGMVLGVGYSLWLLNKILFGNIKTAYIVSFKDLTRLEFFCLLPFLFLTLFLGIFPEVIINYIYIV